MPLKPGLLCLLLLAAAAAAATGAQPAGGNTWAVIVSSSRFWLNYRHTSNALGVYQAIRRLGVPDSRIVLMLAESMACNPRNARPGEVASGARAGGSLYSTDIQVDYSGREVGVQSVLRVLTGHHEPGTPASKRLLSNANSSVLLYLTGHGGDEFLKFHDQTELLAADVAGALRSMRSAGRYRQLLLLADTCQASTLWRGVSEPGVLGIASSKLGESSYAHHADSALGLHVADEFTYHLEQFLLRMPAPAYGAGGEGAGASSSNSSSGGQTSRSSSSSRSGGSSSGSGADGGPTLQQLVTHIRGQRLSSTVVVRADLFPRPLSEVRVAEFFAAEPPPLLSAAPRFRGEGDAAEAVAAAGGWLGAPQENEQEQQLGGQQQQVGEQQKQLQQLGQLLLGAFPGVHQVPCWRVLWEDYGGYLWQPAAWVGATYLLARLFRRLDAPSAAQAAAAAAPMMH